MFDQPDTDPISGSSLRFINFRRVNRMSWESTLSLTTFATHLINRHRAFNNYLIKFFWYLKDFRQTPLLMTQSFNEQETWKESNFPSHISLELAVAYYVTGNWTMWTESSPCPVSCHTTQSWDTLKSTHRNKCGDFYTVEDVHLTYLEKKEHMDAAQILVVVCILSHTDGVCFFIKFEVWLEVYSKIQYEHNYFIETLRFVLIFCPDNKPCGN